MHNAIFTPGTVAGPMSSIVETGSIWSTFVHSSDNRIHQLNMSNPNALDYTDLVVGGPTPMCNSPVAAVSWGIYTLQASVSSCAYPNRGISRTCRLVCTTSRTRSKSKRCGGTQRNIIGMSLDRLWAMLHLVALPCTRKWRRFRSYSGWVSVHAQL
jgi:hypothetical protein